MRNTVNRLLLFTLFISCHSSFGWLRVTDKDAKEDFFLCRRGQGRSQVWALDDKVQLNRLDFLLDDSTADAPPFQVELKELENYLSAQTNPTRAREILDRLSDEKHSWPVAVDDETHNPNDFQLVRGFVLAEGEKWRESIDVQEADEEPLTVPSRPRQPVPDPSLIEQNLLRAKGALQQGVNDIRSRASQAYYPGTEPLEIRDIERSELPERRGIHEPDVLFPRSSPVSMAGADSGGPSWGGRYVPRPELHGDMYPRDANGHLRPRDRYFNIVHPFGPWGKVFGR